MQNQAQDPQQEEQQPRTNFLQMLLIFLLIRNVMNTFTNPPQRPTAESIIDNYNQTYQEPAKTAEPVPMGNPLSAMTGMMKGMMPIQMGIKGSKYMPTILDGDLCVCISFIHLLFSLSMFIILKLKMTVQ